MANLQVTDSYAVNSKILALRIETGDITSGTQAVYQPRNGDFTNDGIVYRDSEAVHVLHLGFHPNDSAKVAFLSTWLGPEGRGLPTRRANRFH